MNVNMEFAARLMQLNFLSVVAVMFFGFFLVINKKYEPVLTRFFTPMFCFLVLLIISDNVDYIMYDTHNASMLHSVIAVIGYNMRILILLRLVTIMDYNITGNVRRSLCLPLILNFCILLLSFGTKLVFWFDEGGAFMRGPLGFSAHVTMLIYMAYALYLAGLCYRRGTREEGMIIVIEIMLGMVGTAVETLCAIRGILAGVVALSMVFYYLYLHSCRFYKDPLTGVLNRASFYADLKQYENNITAICSIDLNGLKSANDTYGHEAGDRLLKNAAESLKQCMLPQCHLYRTGGDEFVILCIGLDEDRVQKLTKRLFACQETDCDFAFGMQAFSHDPQTTFRMADDAMYANKRSMKAKNGSI